MPSASKKVPTARNIGIALVVGIALLFMYLLYSSGQTSGLSDVNAIEYAVIARNIAAHGTFTTDILKPLSLAKIPRLANHPDLIYPPLFPLWEAMWLKWMGLSERAIPLADGAWLFITGLALLLIGNAWFGPRVGATAAILYILNASMLSYAAGGVETPMLAFELLVLFAAVASFVNDSPKRLWKAALIGALAAALYLTKYVWGLAFLPAVIAIFLGTPARHRFKLAAICVFAFVLVTAPWLVRNTLVAGNPFFSFRWLESVMHTRTYPGNTLYRTFTTAYPHWLLFAVTSPREVLMKARTGTMVVYADALLAAGPYVGAFFIAAILVVIGTRGFEVARYVFYATYLLVIAALLILFPAPRLTAPIASVATLIGVAFFTKLLSAIAEGAPEKRRNRIMLTGLVVLGILQAIPTIQRLSAGRPASAVRTDQVRMAARQVASLIDGPVVTDVPWPVAWFGEKQAIWLPTTLDDLHKIEDRVGPVKWLLLTPFVRRTQDTERTQTWAKMWEDAMRREIIRAGFAVYRRLPGNWILFRRTTLAPPRRK